jgi:type IV secretory pathway VirB2 component (pilin)
VSHTFSPQADRRAAGLGGTAALAAAVLVVVVFLPPEGLVLTPIHAVLDGLLGRATFVLPVAFVLLSALAFTRRARPQTPIPRRRLAGLVLITIALIPADRLLGQSTGLVGEWFTGFLLDLFGPVVAVVLVIMLVIAGIALTFDLTRWRRPVATR